MDPENYDAYWGMTYNKYLNDKEIFNCPSNKPVYDLYNFRDPPRLQHAAYGLNSYIRGRKIESIKFQAKYIVTHDHVEPKMDNDSEDMFFSDGSYNLRQYRVALEQI